MEIKSKNECNVAILYFFIICLYTTDWKQNDETCTFNFHFWLRKIKLSPFTFSFQVLTCLSVFRFWLPTFSSWIAFSLFFFLLLTITLSESLFSNQFAWLSSVFIQIWIIKNFLPSPLNWETKIERKRLEKKFFKMWKKS